MVLMEERLLFRLIQWIQEGLASTDENMEDNAGKEAFSMLTRRSLHNATMRFKFCEVLYVLAVFMD